MQWIPGDKCVLNEAVFSRFNKSFGAKVCREPEVYVVSDIDPYQAVVIIVGRKGPTPVLATWILPVKERDWGGCRMLVNTSSGPVELVRKLHREEPAASQAQEGKAGWGSLALRAGVNVALVLVAILSPIAAVIGFLLLRAWDRSLSAGF